MLASLWWYLDRLSPHQQRKNKEKKRQIWTPLAKLSGSAHERVNLIEPTDKNIITIFANLDLCIHMSSYLGLEVTRKNRTSVHRTSSIHCTYLKSIASLYGKEKI